MNYTFSFTAGSLILEETRKIAESYLNCNNWEQVKTDVLKNNILQKQSISSSKRQTIEIIKRLKNIPEESIYLIAHEDSLVGKNITYYAVLKTYRFIYDFVREVICEKYFNLDKEILNLDYTKFYNRKKNISKKLAKLSDNTKQKIKQVIFKILAESNLIDSTRTKIITKPFLSNKARKIIYNDKREYLKCFLLTDNEIKNLKG